MPEAIIKVEGMHCDGCSGRVAQSLSKLEGVRNAEADHEAGEATVTLVAGQADDLALREAVEKPGYEVIGTDHP